MANKINNVPTMKPEAETPIIVNGSDNPEAAEEKKVERNADRAAHKASQSEQTFDKDHNIFSN